MNSGTLFASAAFVPVYKSDVTQWSGTARHVLGPLFLELQGQSGWLLPALLLAAPVTTWARSRYGDPSSWIEVKELLDQLRARVFDAANGSDDQDFRVTLFRHQRFYLSWTWPWKWIGGWMVAVERSGHMTRKRVSAFRVGDDAKDCEGVAGRSWSCPYIYVEQLPALAAPGASAIDFEEYSRKTYVSVERLKLRPPAARAMLGMRVEAKGKRWGVIVVDTTGVTIKRKRFESEFQAIAAPLGRLLSRT